MEMEPGMLHVIEKILLYWVRFDIVHNESAHKNMTNVESPFFHRVQNKISIFIKQSPVWGVVEGVYQGLYQGWVQIRIAFDIHTFIIEFEFNV